MTTYTAPVEDMMFLYEKLRNNKSYNELEKYKDVTPDLVKNILEEAAKINQNIILPLAKVGDEQPAILENGVVRTPPGYKEAYKKYIEDGWTSLSCDPKYGGQGMPKTVSAFFDEMLSSASLSFKLYSELSIGAYNCINHHATNEVKDKYLPKMVEGKWSGTMCLTEPICGTDLGLLKTKAVEQSDGTYKLSGQKIFITSGDHDLTENIIHLVIARSTDSPSGTRGISLFLVPKYIVNDDGSLGPRNGISTGSIESKMGIKGSATCVLNFDDAVGYMIGPKNKGLNSMFTMMNLERIVVGIQGLGISEIAYQNSLMYSKERKQGKSNNNKTSNGSADFIIEHADIRRSLLNMKSIIEGERALCFWLSQQTEVSLNHENEKIKQEAADFVSLMTPVVKALFTDMGSEITSEAMQIFGGYGYTKDQGIEQLYRDNRITPIYEGTNSVQAIDLVFRKLVNKNGDIIDRYINMVKKEMEINNNEKIAPFIAILDTYLEKLSSFTSWVKDKIQNSKDDANAASNDYLKVLGLVAVGYSWLKVLQVSFEDYDNNKNFYEDKIQTANFFFQRVLPRIDTHCSSAMSGSRYIMDFKFN
ncbi:acyl-CoA dehydrogenase C-terminal domain-containing protein [Candidatus Pelagibacter sp.]|nr:acyl-CoA dehydrogenase C-terminal domain-containing protein [Candidatus Pelagibacter sp.]